MQSDRVLETLIASDSVKVVSLDVFDTVLTRRTAEPRGIFMIMSRELLGRVPGLDQSFIDEFCQHRIAAERVARQRGAGEVTLQEIYEELAQAHSLTSTTVEQIAELEIEYEAASLLPVPALENLIDRCRKLGKRILFVSDMYLPESVVRGILQSFGLLTERDKLYVSSEHRVTKGEGGLFRLVLKREQCRLTEVIHIGDNRHSDVLKPQSLGITAYHFVDTVLTNKERILLSDGDLLGQYLAGAARMARLQRLASQNPTHQALYCVGASIAGPIFNAYLSWIARLAHQIGVRRLYFVSRDGQILHEMAKILFRDLGLELRYLYGSRQAWHLPALTEITENELYWLTIADPHLTVRVLAGRVLLDPTTVQDALREEGGAYDLDTVLSSTEIQHVRDILVGQGRLARLIKEKAAALRQDTIGYLRQEGLFDQVPWALVDLGWFGNMQDSLQKMLSESNYSAPVRGFYFGLLKEPLPGKLKHPYLFSPSSNQKAFECGSCFVQIAELFACGDHGSTVCYHKVSERYEPVLKDRSGWIDDWGLSHLRAGVFNYVKMLPNQLCLDGYDQRERVLQLMQNIFFTPTCSEALALGEYKFSSDQGETVLRSFAPPLSLMDSLRYIRSCTSLDRFDITFWLNGSRVRSSRHVNLFLIICSQLFYCYYAIKRWVCSRRVESLDKVYSQ